MIGANGDATLARLGVIVGIELIGNADALGALNKDKRYGVVGFAVYFLMIFTT